MFRRNNIDRLEIHTLPSSDPVVCELALSDPLTNGGMFWWQRDRPGETTRRHHANLTPFGVCLQYALTLLDSVKTYSFNGNTLYIEFSAPTPLHLLENYVGRASGRKYYALFGA